MFEPVSRYLHELVTRGGRGWNLFWFLPSRPEALSLMRPLIGMVALWWHLSFTADFLEFFGPQGAISLETLDAWTGDRTQFSYFTLVSSRGELLFLHWLGGAVLLLFAVGLLTRLATVLSLVVVLSYIHRGPMLTSEFEPVLAMVLCYFALGEVFSIFEQRQFGALSLLSGGPAGAAFSVDARLARRPSHDVPAYATRPDFAAATTSATVATRLLQVHLAAIYLISGLTMLSTEPWWTGEAVWWLISRPEENAFPLAQRLNSHPWIVNLWTHTIVAGELAFAVLVWNRLTRPLMLAVSGLVWLLVGVASGEYLFSLMMFVASLVFVSPELIREVWDSRRAGHSGPTVAEPVASGSSR